MIKFKTIIILVLIHLFIDSFLVIENFINILKDNNLK